MTATQRDHARRSRRPTSAATTTTDRGAEDEPALEHAGALSAFVTPGELRYVRLGSEELVRRAHVAIRDTSWATIPIAVGAVETISTPGGSLLRSSGGCLGDGLDLEVVREVASVRTGAFELSVEVRARAATAYNRIGLCVLLPSHAAGRRYRASSPTWDGEGRLPREVGPQRIDESGRIYALFAPFTELSVAMPSATLHLSFDGDEFEMEDQRNWADASFKVYSTPLALGFPHRLAAGERLRQRVVISAVPR